MMLEGFITTAGNLVRAIILCLQNRLTFDLFLPLLEKLKIRKIYFHHY